MVIYWCLPTPMCLASLVMWGKVLADENVNVAQMAVGREGAAGSSAIGVLNLDNVASEVALRKVASNDAIESATLINLPAVGELPEWLE